MTNDLGGSRAAAGMSLDAVGAALNDGIGHLDAAITKALTVPVDATNTVTLTAAQFTGNLTFILTDDGCDAAVTMNVPDENADETPLVRGNFNVINNTGQDVTVQVSGQSETPPVLTDGQASILVMDGSDVRLAVPQGSVGADGVSAGIRWDFDTSTTTTSDPGTGNLRLNDATLASVTEVALSDSSTEIGNPDVSAFLAVWDDSTASTKGHMIIAKASAPQNFAVYAVTAGTDATTHWRFTVTHVDSAGSFSDEDTLAVQFVPKGDVGAGSTIAVEDSDQSPSSINASTETLIFGDGLSATDNGDGSVTVASAKTFDGTVARRTSDLTGQDIRSTTAFSFQEADPDVFGLWSAGTPDRLTIPAALDGAWVMFVGLISVFDDTFTTWDGGSLVLRNSADTNLLVVGGTLRDHLGSSWSESITLGPYQVSTGDYAQLQGRTESDTSVTITSNTQLACIILGAP